MTKRKYTIIGWLVWNLATTIARWKLSRNKAKLGAAAVVALVLVGGVVAAKSTGDDE